MTTTNSTEEKRLKEKIDMISRVLEEDSNHNTNIYYGKEVRYKEKVALIKEILKDNSI